MSNDLLAHPLDLDDDVSMPLDLFAEELPEQRQLLSDCLASVSSFACSGGCIGSFSSVGSIISCGDDDYA